VCGRSSAPGSITYISLAPVPAGRQGIRQRVGKLISLETLLKGGTVMKKYICLVL